MGEEIIRRDHRSVAITREAYDLLTEKAKQLRTDKKAIASEAIINFFEERTILLQMKVLTALALVVAGALIGVVLVMII